MTTKEIVDLNYARYTLHHKELFKKYPHKFLVISDQKVQGAFDSFGEADEFGVKEIGLGKFLLHKVEAHPTIAQFGFYGLMMNEYAKI
jgi:hypothetical protein